MRLLEHMGKALSHRVGTRCYAVFILIGGHERLQPLGKLLWIREIGSIEVDMKHRIGQPLLLQLLDGESMEELLAPQEIVLQGRDQKALAETPGTA